MPTQPRGWGRTSARRVGTTGPPAGAGAHPGLEVAPGVAQPLQTGEEFQKLGFLPGTLAEILGDGRYQGIFVVPQEGFEGIRRRRRVARSGKVRAGWRHEPD